MVQRAVRDMLQALKSGSNASPPDETEAQRLFELVRGMEPGAGARKAPLLQVFRLYCLENLTAARVARRCGCSKSLVVARLSELGQRLGRHPSTLRAVSGHVERVRSR